MKDKNIYHCCIQKSGSQWIKKILSDPLIQEKTGLKIHTPEKDFILAKNNRDDLHKKFPVNTIVSPLYIIYDDFLAMLKADNNYKAFWVMRDPRDLIISRYFSQKYSHIILNPHQKKEREFLNDVSIEEGLRYFIEAIPSRHQPLYFSMINWLKSTDNPAVIICKYEDLIGNDQLNSFKVIFRHCGIDISDSELAKLLKNHSFEHLAKGRKQGTENQLSHYRKGIVGDWKNYFTNDNKKLFKRLAGQMLIDLRYERNNNW